MKTRVFRKYKNIFELKIFLKLNFELKKLAKCFNQILIVFQWWIEKVQILDSCLKKPQFSIESHVIQSEFKKQKTPSHDFIIIMYLTTPFLRKAVTEKHEEILGC